MGLFALLPELLNSCNNKAASPPSLTIGQLLAGDTSLTIVYKAIDKAGLLPLLNSASTLTLFAPNDTACASAGLTEAVVESLSADSLRNLLNGHLLATALLPSKIPDTVTRRSVNFLNLHITNNANGLFVNGSSILQTTLASNGLLQTIGKVLVQPTQTIAHYLRSDTSFSKITAVYNTAGILGLIDSVGSFTLFAPNNAAFTTSAISADSLAVPGYDTLLAGTHLLGSICLSSDFIHGGIFKVENRIIPNSRYGLSPDTLSTFTIPALSVHRYRSVSIPASNIVTKDILCTNGVIHTVDRVIQ